MLRGPYLYADRGRLLNPVSAQIAADPKVRLAATTMKSYGCHWRLLQRRYPDHRITDFTREELEAFMTLGHAIDTTIEPNPHRPARTIKVTRARINDDGTWVLRPRVVGEPGWTENTVNQNINAFSFIFGWALRKGLIEKDPTIGLRADYGPGTLRTHRRHVWLTRPEVDAMTDVSGAGEDPFAFRDRVLCQFAVGTGLRAAELVAAVWGDLENDGEVTQLHVNRGKGDKYRQVPPTPKTVAVLGEWRRRSEALLGRPLLDSDHIFPASRKYRVGAAGRFTRGTSTTQAFEWGKGLNYSGVVGVVKAAGDRIGRPSLLPHDLRRTYAGLLEDFSIDIRTISKNLGHSSVATTERYLADNPTKRAAAVAGVSF